MAVHCKSLVTLDQKKVELGHLRHDSATDDRRIDDETLEVES